MTSFRKTVVCVAGLAAVALTGCYSYGYAEDPNQYSGPVVNQAPPAPIVEEPPPEPFVGAIWMPGFWGWGGAAYAWTPGYYVRPRPGQYWYPGGWVSGRGGWRFVRGRWAPPAYGRRYRGRRYVHGASPYYRSYHRRYYRSHPKYSPRRRRYAPGRRGTPRVGGARSGGRGKVRSRAPRAH